MIFHAHQRKIEDLPIRTRQLEYDTIVSFAKYELHLWPRYQEDASIARVSFGKGTNECGVGLVKGICLPPKGNETVPLLRLKYDVHVPLTIRDSNQTEVLIPE